MERSEIVRFPLTASCKDGCSAAVTGEQNCRRPFTPTGFRARHEGMSARRIEIELSDELADWIERHQYYPDLSAAVMYILEQTKRAAEYDRLTEQMEREFPLPKADRVNTLLVFSSPLLCLADQSGAASPNPDCQRSHTRGKLAPFA